MFDTELKIRVSALEKIVRDQEYQIFILKHCIDNDKWEEACKVAFKEKSYELLHTMKCFRCF